MTDSIPPALHTAPSLAALSTDACRASTWRERIPGTAPAHAARAAPSTYEYDDMPELPGLPELVSQFVDVRAREGGAEPIDGGRPPWPSGGPEDEDEDEDEGEGEGEGEGGLIGSDAAGHGDWGQRRLSASEVMRLGAGGGPGHGGWGEEEVYDEHEEVEEEGLAGGGVQPLSGTDGTSSIQGAVEEVAAAAAAASPAGAAAVELEPMLPLSDAPAPPEADHLDFWVKARLNPPRSKPKAQQAAEQQAPPARPAARSSLGIPAPKRKRPPLSGGDAGRRGRWQPPPPASALSAVSDVSGEGGSSVAKGAWQKEGGGGSGSSSRLKQGGRPRGRPPIPPEERTWHAQQAKQGGGQLKKLGGKVAAVSVVSVAEAAAVGDGGGDGGAGTAASAKRSKHAKHQERDQLPRKRAESLTEAGGVEGEGSAKRARARKKGTAVASSGVAAERPGACSGWPLSGSREGRADEVDFDALLAEADAVLSDN
jgi:hypothetical protein